MNASRPTSHAPLILLLAALALAPLGACARTPHTTKPVAAGGPFDSNRALERAIRHEMRHPSREAMSAPAPPGLDVSSLKPIPQDDADAFARAHLSVDEALDQVGEFFPSSSNVAPLDVSADDRRRAVILYARGRALRLDGQYKAAIGTLESAAKLDPDAAAPWRELGQARLALSDRHGAAIAFSRAFDRDPTDIRTLEQLASLPSTETDDKQTAAILAHLYRSNSNQSDPALQYLVPARLGSALLNLGYISAGAQLIEEAVELPDRFDTPSNRTQDLAALYRRRGDLWSTIGDADMRLAKPDDALHAYSQAAQLPSLDPTGLLLRRVHAAMLLGRPATAGSFVLERLAAADARADERLLQTLHYVARNSKVGDDLDNAILDLQASLPETERRLAGPSIVRARAAVLPPDRAIQIERDYLAQHPADETVLSGLFAQLATDGPGPALRETVSLTAQTPLRSDEFVAALLRAVPEPDTLMSAWPSLDEQTRASAPARLVHARLLAVAKRPVDADNVLQKLLADHPGYPPALIARVRLLEVLDRGPEADALLRSIEPGANVNLAYAKALALTEREDLAAAERVVQSALAIAAPDDPRRIDLLLLGAQLAAKNSDYTLAEQRYLEVLKAEPAREEAHAGLVQLYASGGPLADDQKLVDELARLRDTNPTSRLLRTLRAREALARGQFDLAERDLLDLTEEYPDDDQAIKTLVQLWIQTGAQDRAELWLKRQMARFPARNIYQILLARTYLSIEHNKEAAQVLDAWLQQYPGDVKVSELLEQIYDQKLHDREAANRLRARRLENAGDSDATAADRAAIYLSLRKFDDFLAALHQAVDYAKANHRDISDWAARMVAALYNGEQGARTGGCPPEIAVQAQGLLCDNVDNLPSVDHLMRLEILARSPGLESKSIDAALRRAVQQNPSDAVNFYRVVTICLTEPFLLHQTDPGKPNAPQRAFRPADHDEIVSRTIIAGRITDDAAALPNLDADDKATVLALQFQSLSTALFADAIPDVPAAPAMADRLADAKNKDAILDAIFTLRSSDRSAARVPNPRQRSQVAEGVGQILSAVGNDAGADAYDELALRYDPDNETVNNNYGYRLLERDDPKRLDEAVRMIERAYKASPQPPSHVVDSLGWARYKSGIIHDVVDKNGNVVTPGAVSLLTRALKLAQNPSNQDPEFEIPILSAHLGDALWLAGDHQRAIDSWRQTVRLGKQAVDQFANDPSADPVIDELRKSVQAAQRKIDAALADRQPDLAPVLRPVNQPSAAPASSGAPEPAKTPADATTPPKKLIEPAGPG